jgi:hypothetical protein
MVKERVDIFTASDKIKSVIDSCISKEHFDGVEKMIRNFHRVYEDDPDEYNCTESLTQYLIQHKS